MELFLVLVALAVVAGVAAVALGHVRGGLDDPTHTRPYRPLPEGRLEPDDVDDVRFSLALRGYRMEEVDAVLTRLSVALAERDDEVRLLRDKLAHRDEPQDDRSAGTDDRGEVTGR
ncbi:MAG TPA: DivIVA domain-containing protein [Actinomycetales bacterium]|nr:DivIVA domain-containing protein [Actinomycetales bacterium]